MKLFTPLLPVILIAGIRLALPWAAEALTERDHYGLASAGAVPDIPALDPDAMRADDVEATFVFFGFHGCTASCPAQLLNMRRLAEGTERDDVRFLYISLAPSEMAASDVAGWLHSLGPAFRGYRPDDAAHARRLVQSFGGFSDHYGETPGAFDHSADLYLVTRDHRVMRYPGTALDLARVRQDLDSLIDR